MTVKSLRKQLAAAIAMTLVATVALGSSTYAWFAINSQVTATGMTFKTQVSDNLFIAPDTLTNTSAVAENLFGTSLVQNVNGILEPVSTINAEDDGFFYAAVTNVKGDGDTKTDSWIAYNPAAPAAFQTNYQAAGAKGFVDYVYRLKATNGGDAAVNLTLTDLTLSYYKGYDGTDVAPSNAFRAAVFVNTITGTNNTQATANSVAAANYNNGTEDVAVASIYKPASATNFTTNATKLQAVDSTSTLADVDYATAATVISVPANTTQYYKVVVRLWLEGEDTTCNNATFVKLDDGGWSLDCGWTLGDLAAASATAVTSLKVETTAGAAANSKVSVAKTTAGTSTTIAGGTYYKLASTISYNGATLDLYANAATVADDTHFFVVINDGVQDVAVDVTELVTITPAP